MLYYLVRDVDATNHNVEQAIYTIPSIHQEYYIMRRDGDHDPEYLHTITGMRGVTYKWNRVYFSTCVIGMFDEDDLAKYMTVVDALNDANVNYIAKCL